MPSHPDTKYRWDAVIGVCGLRLFPPLTTFNNIKEVSANFCPGCYSVCPPPFPQACKLMGDDDTHPSKFITKGCVSNRVASTQKYASLTNAAKNLVTSPYNTIPMVTVIIKFYLKKVNNSFTLFYRFYSFHKYFCDFWAK